MAVGVEAEKIALSSEIYNMYPAFLHPEGIPPDPEPIVTPSGRILPGWPTALHEYEDLIEAVYEDLFPHMTLPKLEQLGRITIAKTTGCWELPVYKNGQDVYPEGSPLAGKSRARYGILRVPGLNEALAHRAMYRIFRGDIPYGNFVDHLCCNKKCCNHRHLEAVTPAENNLRARVEAKAKRGELPLFI